MNRTLRNFACTLIVLGFGGAVASAQAPPQCFGIYASRGISSDYTLVSWVPVATATSYRVSRHTAPNMVGQDIGTTSDNVFYDTTAEFGVRYYYRVKAVNSFGASGWCSNDQGWRGVLPHTPPTHPPTQLNATRGHYPDHVIVSFQTSPNAITYQVYRSTLPGVLGSPIEGPIWHTALGDFTALPGVHYYYSVVAINEFGSTVSSASQGWRSTSGPAPPNNPPSQAPTGVDAANGGSNDYTLITWQAVSGAAGYRVFRSTHLGQLGTQIGGQYSILAYRDYDVEPLDRYFYTVVSVNEAGEGPASVQDEGWRGEFASAPLPPEPPIGVTASTTIPTHVAIDWQSVPGAAHYRVFRSQSAGSFGIRIVDNWWDNAYDDYTAQPGVRYFYSVVACDNVGPSFWSEQVEGRLDNPVTCPADLNGDGLVDAFDLLVLLAEWGPNAGNSADLDGNGTVNVLDLMILLDSWGQCL